MDNTLKYNKPWILQRADPYVYRHTDGAYYFTASVPEYDRIVLRKSDTLAGLETADETEIWHKHESGPQSIHIWAPELHYLFGNVIDGEKCVACGKCAEVCPSKCIHLFELDAARAAQA